jgi:hypothetical protein
MINGLILGDGSLIRNGKYIRLGIEQKDKDFVFYIWEKLKPLGIVGAEPRYCIRKRLNKEYYSYQFFTFTLPYFTDLYTTWYKLDQKSNKFIKKIPDNIKDLITPISLANWIAGDGSYKKKGNRMFIHTNNFTEQEVNLLISILNEKFTLNTYINIQKNYKNNKSYPLITISSKDINIIRKLIKNHMPTGMLYRIGL